MRGANAQFTQEITDLSTSSHVIRWLNKILLKYFKDGITLIRFNIIKNSTFHLIFFIFQKDSSIQLSIKNLYSNIFQRNNFKYIIKPILYSIFL